MNVGVVRSVLARIRDKAVGAEVSKALDPAQQVVKTVHAELIGLLGGETLKITQARAGHWSDAHDVQRLGYGWHRVQN